MSYPLYNYQCWGCGEYFESRLDEIDTLPYRHCNLGNSVRKVKLEVKIYKCPQCHTPKKFERLPKGCFAYCGENWCHGWFSEDCEINSKEIEGATALLKWLSGNEEL